MVVNKQDPPETDELLDVNVPFVRQRIGRRISKSTACRELTG
jgi:hypothetical protein